MNIRFYFVFLILVLAMTACSSREDVNKDAVPAPSPAEVTPTPTPAVPDLQAELLDGADSTTDSPIGKFDFHNFTFPLPRGWQNPDGSTEITISDGKLEPVAGNSSGYMSNDQKAEEKSRRRIGMSYVTTKFLDMTGDGEDEAVVILKIETAGTAMPHAVYVYQWKDGQPELIWPFRTGDRADGGLKRLYVENGDVVIELYGQDRWLLGQTETGKITGDEEQLCCPSHFTRSRYKWNGKSFLLQGKRLTLEVADPASPAAENMGDQSPTPKPARK